MPPSYTSTKTLNTLSGDFVCMGAISFMRKLFVEKDTHDERVYRICTPDEREIRKWTSYYDAVEIEWDERRKR